MNKEIKIILVKFMILTIFVIAYVFIAVYFISPAVTHVAFGQQFPQDQFNTNQQFGQQQNQQFGSTNNQFDQNQQFGQNQFGNNQFQQQPYQQYGTPTTYGPQQYGPYQQQQGYGGFGIQEIITAIIAGGGSAVYTKRRTSQLHDDNQQLYSEILKGKQVDAELARITYQMNQDKANTINDAPTIKLENLQQDVQQFTDKTSKA